jgi:hypothetical protein
VFWAAYRYNATAFDIFRFQLGWGNATKLVLQVNFFTKLWPLRIFEEFGALFCANRRNNAGHLNPFNHESSFTPFCCAFLLCIAIARTKAIKVLD